MLSRVIAAGEWTLSYHGPDISIVHNMHPQQTLRLGADGVELEPAPSAIALLLGLQLPANPVIKVQLERLVLQPAPTSFFTHTHTSSATVFSASAKGAGGHVAGGSPTSSTNAAEALGDRILELAG
jgi:hypothetical protein